MSLEEEKRTSEECDNLLDGEKASLEERMATLDGSVERFSQRIEVLVDEKTMLEDQVEDVSRLLEGEGMRRKVVQDDLKWLLQKGVVRVVDRVVESTEFSLGVRRMKVASMATEVEGGKQVIREEISIGKFMPGEPSTLLEHTLALHAEVKSFLETDFAS